MFTFEINKEIVSQTELRNEQKEKGRNKTGRWFLYYGQIGVIPQKMNYKGKKD